jgi:hypothetical protein
MTCAEPLLEEALIGDNSFRTMPIRSADALASEKSLR